MSQAALKPEDFWLLRSSPSGLGSGCESDCDDGDLLRRSESCVQFRGPAEDPFVSRAVEGQWLL